MTVVYTVSEHPLLGGKAKAAASSEDSFAELTAVAAQLLGVDETVYTGSALASVERAIVMQLNYMSLIKPEMFIYASEASSHSKQAVTYRDEIGSGSSCSSGAGQSSERQSWNRLGQHQGGSMIEIGVDLEITPALVKFERIAGRFTNFVPVMGGRVDVLARRLIRRMFDTQGRASGRGQWAPLTENYIKRRVFPGKPLLRQSDELYQALTERGNANQELTLTRNRYSLTVGGNVRARFVGHQLGLPEQNLPARQMIPDPLPETFIRQVRQAVKAYIVRGETR